MRKSILGLFILLLTVSSAVGFDLRGPRGSGSEGPGGAGVSYSVRLYPDALVIDQKEQINLRKQSINFSIPLWRSRGRMLSFYSIVSRTRISTDAILVETTQLFPDVLWNLGAGFNFMFRFSNRWIGGFSAILVSAGDEPFKRSDNFRVGVSGFVQIPVRNHRDCWRLSIIYSPFSDVQIPIPGIAYGWNPTYNLGINIGVPFSMIWQMSEKISMNLSWAPRVNINAGISYRLSDLILLHTEYETGIESYYLSNRTDSEERFLSHEKRFKVGAILNINQSMILDLNSGYVFDRYYAETDNMYGQIDNPIDIGSGIFLEAGVSFGHRNFK